MHIGVVHGYCWPFHDHLADFYNQLVCVDAYAYANYLDKIFFVSGWGFNASESNMIGHLQAHQLISYGVSPTKLVTANTFGYDSFQLPVDTWGEVSFLSELLARSNITPTTMTVFVMGWHALRTEAIYHGMGFPNVKVIKTNGKAQALRWIYEGLGYFLAKVDPKGTSFIVKKERERRLSIIHDQIRLAMKASEMTFL